MHTVLSRFEKDLTILYTIISFYIYEAFIYLNLDNFYTQKFLKCEIGLARHYCTTDFLAVGLSERQG